MQLKRLKIHNFMRIREAELDFSGKDVIGILAKGMFDEKRSNYLGKSTILEAMRFAITGKSRASKAVQLIHFGEKTMEIELDLESDSGEIYTIRRGVDHKGKGLTEVGWGDKKRESQQTINDLLGIDEKDFDMTFFFKQAEINKFMALGSAEQKKMMMKWQKNDHWQEKEKAVNEDIKKYKEKIKEEEIILRNLELNIGNVEDIEGSLFYTSQQVSAKEELLGVAKKKLKTLNENASVSENEYKRIKRELSNTASKLEKVEKKLAEVKKAAMTVDNLEDELAPINFKGLKEAEEKHNLKGLSATSESFRLSEKIEKIKKSGNGLCPILDEECDRLNLSEEQIDKMLSEARRLADLGKREKIIARDIKEEHDEYYKLWEELKEAREKLDHEDMLLENSRMLKEEIQSYKEALDSYDPDFNKNLANLTSKIDALEYEIPDLKDELSVLKHKYGEYEKNEKEIEKLRSSLIKRNTILSDLQYVSFTFGKNGIPSLEIENSFQEIEEEINYMLEEIDQTLSIECKPDRELKTWEELCLSCGHKYEKGTKKHSCKKCGTPRRKKRKDELQLNVIQNHNEMPFEMCSGGLKTITSLCVRTALTMLLKRQNGTNLNVLFLDEIDSALDESNKEKIKKIVSQVFIKKLGFKQIFWISHDKTISEAVPHTILVKGYEDYSELEWV
jgi:DNA repair exonuclease SbcCD ATPase subunit